MKFIGSKAIVRGWGCIQWKCEQRAKLEYRVEMTGEVESESTMQSAAGENLQILHCLESQTLPAG